MTFLGVIATGSVQPARLGVGGTHILASHVIFIERKKYNSKSAQVMRALLVRRETHQSGRFLNKKSIKKTQEDGRGAKSAPAPVHSICPYTPLHISISRTANLGTTRIPPFLISRSHRTPGLPPLVSAEIFLKRGCTPLLTTFKCVFLNFCSE